MRKCLMGGVAALLVLLATPAIASAATAEKNVNGGCRVGAQAFEHWTAARHVSYDDNGGCARIHQTALRRCWGTNYAWTSGYLTVNTIDKQWTGCDAIYTQTRAQNSSGTYLGMVQATQ